MSELSCNWLGLNLSHDSIHEWTINKSCNSSKSITNYFHLTVPSISVALAPGRSTLHRRLNPHVKERIREKTGHTYTKINKSPSNNKTDDEENPKDLIIIGKQKLFEKANHFFSPDCRAHVKTMKKNAWIYVLFAWATTILLLLKYNYHRHYFL